MYQYSSKSQRGQDTAIARATYGIAHLLPDARPREAAPVGGAVLTSALVCDSIDVHNSCSGTTLLGYESSNAGYHSRRGLQPPTIGRGADGIKRANWVGSQPPARRVFAANETDSADVDLSATSAIKCDVELARIAVGLRQSAQMRLWLIIAEHVRTSGYPYISRVDLMALLERCGVKFTRHNLNRWLRVGQGVYWRLTTYRRVYLVSYEHLAVNLTIEAHRHKLPDLVSTNLPGQTKAMYIDVASSSLLQFEAHCLKAWYANRNNPTISRFTLKHLWNRDERSLRRLEALARITVIPNEVETIEPSHVPLNADGTLRSDVYRTRDAYQRTVYHFRLPNTFQAGIVRQHHRRGAGRRVFGIVRSLLSSEALAGLCGQGDEVQLVSGELCRSGRRYCETPKTAKRNRRRGNVGMLFVPDKPGRGRGVVWGIYHSV